MPTFPVTASDTGLTVSDSLRRGVTRTTLVSAAFPSFAPASQLLDNFNRANENPLSQGGNWTNLGTTKLQLVSNGVVGLSASGNNSMSYSGAGDFTDCDAWVTLTGTPTPGSSYAGVIARQRHNGFVIATGQANPGANEIILQYVNVGGGVTALGTWPITTSPGDSVGIRCVGTTISAYYKPVGGDWQLLGSATDTNEPSGYIGLTTNDTVYAMDNFGGGAPSPARPFDSIQPNHFTIAVSDDIFLTPFASSTGVLDDFNRPNESPLSGGGRWTRTGTFGSSLNLVSHSTLPATVSQIDSMSYVAAGDLRDCEAWATLFTLPWSGSSGDAAGVILRQNPATDSQKDCYILSYSGGSTPTLSLTYTNASGTSTTLGQWTGLGLANGDSIGLRAVGTKFTAYIRHGTGAWQVVGAVTDSSGSHGYLGLQQITTSGIPNAITNFGGGPIALHDSIAAVRAPLGLFPVIGLTVTDSLSRVVTRPLSVTGLTITDGMIIFLNGRTLVGLTDNGLVLSESIQKTHLTGMVDTGLTVSDSVVASPARRVLPVDQLIKTTAKLLTATGLTVTDTLRRYYPIALTTTGLTVTDSLTKVARKSMADTGLTLTTGFQVQVNGHNAQVQLTDAGVTVVPVLAKSGRYFRATADTGLTIHAGLRVKVTPPTRPRKPTAAFHWSGTLLTANFVDDSTPGSAPIDSWEWHFGDGATSSATNPTHTYSTAGTYNVSLTVTTIYGSSTITKPITVSGTVGAGTHIDAVIF
jgi:PKD domain-containing protein